METHFVNRTKSTYKNKHTSRATENSISNVHCNSSNQHSTGCSNNAVRMKKSWNKKKRLGKKKKPKQVVFESDLSS